MRTIEAIKNDVSEADDACRSAYVALDATPDKIAAYYAACERLDSLRVEYWQFRWDIAKGRVAA